MVLLIQVHQMIAIQKNLWRRWDLRLHQALKGTTEEESLALIPLLGLKYQIAAVRAEKFSSYEYTENNYYKRILEQGNYIVYENPFALPIAFMVNDDLKDVKTSNVTTYLI